MSHVLLITVIIDTQCHPPFVQLIIGHVARQAIAGSHYTGAHVVGSLQMIGKWNLRVPYRRMSCSDLIRRQDA